MHSRLLFPLRQAVAAAALSALPHIAIAGGQIVENTTIISVAVNGGTDTINPGTSCLKVASALPAACTAGYVAIPNNNKQLLAAALMSKASGGKVALYFHDEVGSNHCPGRVFTPCSVISIEPQ